MKSSDVLEVMTICLEQGTPGIPGKMVACSECALEIFLSSSTIENAMSQGNNVKLNPYCLECGYDLAIETIPETAPLSDKQVKEIQAALRNEGLI